MNSDSPTSSENAELVPLLIVDADADNRAFWSAELGKYGFSVLHAEDGPEALAVLRVHRVKAVILDLELSRAERKSLFLELQSEALGNPYIFLMVAASTMSREDGYDLGACAVLAKPVMPQYLVSWLRGLLVPGPTRWRAGRETTGSRKRPVLSATLPQVRLGRGGFALPLVANAGELLEGDSVEFNLQVDSVPLRGTGIVRYVKLDKSKLHQQAWGIEFETLDEPSVDYVLRRTSAEKPQSYIPSLG